jgi:hypothetical protein
MLIFLLVSFFAGDAFAQNQDLKTRIIITSDAEIDDECSFVRCLLYANDFDIEGIISTSSQYHAHDHNWAGDDWYVKYLDAYTEVYPNLLKHDSCYPLPDSLKAITHLGNVSTEGDMEEPTPGSQHIVKVLLDTSDDRPVWLTAWGGMNTIARALKSIEEEYPDRMAYVAKKIRFFFIWEQDNTFQTYIKPVWGKYNIPTIISDQFIALFYKWKEYIPYEQQHYLVGSWMNENIKNSHGPLCALYQSLDNGDFRSEGDSPSFMHAIPTGLRNLENPGWGGWAGRYTRVMDNIWLDPVSEPGYQYPEGRWYTSTAWGRTRLKLGIPDDTLLIAYLKPIWRWMGTFQNDFASRADWCVKAFEETNHPPVVKLAHGPDLQAMPGDTVYLSASGTKDPDGDELHYRWWYYPEAGSYDGKIEIRDSEKQRAFFAVPGNFCKGQSIHIICEVTDSGSPPLTRYQRVVVGTNAPAYPKNLQAALTGITTVTLSWESISEDVSGIRIERAEGDSGSYAMLAEVGMNDTVYIDSMLQELTLYRYRVGAFNDSLSSGYDGTVSVSTLSAQSLPVAVDSPNPADNTLDVVLSPVLLWEASINSDSYDVYFGTVHPPPFVTNQTETTFSTGALDAETSYYWRIDGNNANGTTAGTIWNFTTEKEPTSIDDMIRNVSFQLQAFPNPFHSSTDLHYRLKSHSEVELCIYNVAGEKMATLVHQWQTAGEHSICFQAGDLETGIYIIRLKAGPVEQRSKIVLIN